MADLGPAYLIHGDDHGAIAERRARLRALVEGDADSGVEVLEGADATPQAAAAALAAMTLAVGRRVIIVEGVERWREADVRSQLLEAMAQMPPQTTIALFAREAARQKAPAALHEAVKKAGGQISAQETVKPWELARWAREQAARLGLALDASGAKALVEQVGQRQQRLLRELEKLALEGGAQVAGEEGGRAGALRAVSAQEIEQRAAHSAEQRAFALADALLAGDARAATRSYLRLCEQGERLPGLIRLIAARLREGLDASLRLRAGDSPAEIRRGVRGGPRAAERFLADVSRRDPEQLRAALDALARLEVDSRGGAPVPSSRTAAGGLHEDTLAQRAIERIAG